ncbi:bifunctional 4-hydroxy-2-oxoglutarate aldolase/2-dehydro-3-deoxy-phosphogluconate aldolase [Pseudofrancisella aestuarii]|uniref:Bifunctional 4-hydroxy-2-oxoglutarate aldolase/2-dehydro-3-deoxy-phosphogluconate aldolase n=1 Tax=Pseudofrancisella aestuarii TaxID=2670347 RepID=A0ABV9T989_9GAMM|nr:bifunctional 4-hydroxy-2-oxoglutarate aldolase/2-dehydro-3-deoxy-phosphogluconate aldolase [Pseudofrancisella aestuarii]
MSLKKILEDNPLIPVVAVNTLEEATSTLEKLRNKNIKIVEFTLRTPNALEVIKEIIKNNDDFIIGIGTIRTLEQLKECSKLKVDFLVSPGATIKMLKFAKKKKLPYLPGGVTPFEIMTILSFGFKILKFFPAEAMGGIKLLKNYQAVFPEVIFCATGGINSSNQDEYLAQKNIIAIGSSSLI